ncbi:discoidin, CUB and LCCL domain-containing protein 2 isoform X2 [Alexandromys fortis]|uniref:discoidin, CUB and LCCL domain-containing protein 2 isoform X2 n=1 Tax=Alexandromys fortis TaxID=100897 RepID=UPI0021536FF1|nr:discoidin, CUB and LCCL domain-containing protein 2 isoform X2 [Microtus fortis]
MASRAPLRAAHSPQGPRGQAAPAATGRAPLPSAGCCPLPPGRNSSSRPGLLLLLLLLLQDVGAQQGDGCGHTVLGPESGTLSSINYPYSYPNSTVCEWEIRVKMGERIRIKFGDFDIEDSDSCHLNYLKIFNGIGVSRTEIGKYCGLGLQMNGSVESKGSEVTVLFMSGIHASGRGFLASYSVIDKQDLITCLDNITKISEPEFSKFCPAGCLLPFAEISGTIPHGYRDSSPLCMAGIHAGVVSNVLGGQISVVISKGTPYYESSLANNVTSVVGYLSPSLFTFKTSGCYGTLGMESGVIADPQITASSVLEWTDHMGQEHSWKPEKARLRKSGPPWAAFATDEHQWLQIDLNKEKKITGIVTTGSTMVEHNYYVSAYRVLYSDDGQKWTVYREPGVEQDKIFQGNKDYDKDVRNNFLPPIIARFIRVNPVQWQQKIALKVELLGCQFALKGRLPKLTQPPPPRNSNNLKNTTAHPKLGRAPKFTQVLQPRSRNDLPAQTAQTTATPDIKNTTVTPNVTKDVALAAVLVPVLVMALTTLILILVCAWHWRNRKKKTEGTYDLPHWDRAEYAQPLVGGVVGTLHQRSTFKPEEGKEAGYADLDPYTSPVQEVYHAYAEPLPITGPEYATPIVMDMSGHPTASVGLPSTSTFKTAGNQPPPALVGTYNTLLSRTDSCSSGQAQYDTPKGGKPAAAPEELVYQVPQSTQEISGAGRDEKRDALKEIL